MPNTLLPATNHQHDSCVKQVLLQFEIMSGRKKSDFKAPMKATFKLPPRMPSVKRIKLDYKKTVWADYYHSVHHTEYARSFQTPWERITHRTLLFNDEVWSFWQVRILVSIMTLLIKRENNQQFHKQISHSYQQVMR